MKLGICNELFEGWDFGRVCRAVKDAGYDGIELAPFTLAPTITELTAARRRELKAVVADAGLETIGLHWLLAGTSGLHLTSPQPEVQRATGDYLIALAEATHDLNGSLMVLGSPKQRSLQPGVTYAQAVETAQSVFTRIMPALEALGVDLCLEPLAPNDTDFINTCAQAMEIIKAVNHPRLRLHLDVKAQSSETGASVPELIRRHAGHAGHFHAQDVNLRGPGMGAVDFVPIMKALVESGYDRWVSVEVFDFSPGAVATAEQSRACLTSALAAAAANSDASGANDQGRLTKDD
jgi:sugar phosphate isomerase/epimerase